MRRRSSEWFHGTGKNAIMHRSWMKNQGIPNDMFDGRPVIGICNTWSELTPCNAHLRELADKVKCGVYESGGYPVEFPVFSCGESTLRPTAMMFRNLASMDVEEAIRGNPIDGVVLLTGCDKTTPSLLMGASSVDIPTIVVSGGPMLNGKWRGKTVGSGTAIWYVSYSFLNFVNYIQTTGSLPASLKRGKLRLKNSWTRNKVWQGLQAVV